MSPDDRRIHLELEVERTRRELQTATDVAMTESMDIDFDEDAGIVNHEALEAVLNRALAKMHAETAFTEATDALQDFSG